jgi:hypothetical protein
MNIERAYSCTSQTQKFKVEQKFVVPTAVFFQPFLIHGTLQSPKKIGGTPAGLTKMKIYGTLNSKTSLKRP